jgi:hypothetical protein
MNISIALMVLADCKVEEQNSQYDNPSEEAPCTCPMCEKYPRPPRPFPCNCAGCQPETPTARDNREDNCDGQSMGEDSEAATKAVVMEEVKRKQKVLMQEMRKVGLDKLVKMRMHIWRSSDIVSTHMDPPEIYIPNSNFKIILDQFYDLTSADVVHQVVKNLRTASYIQEIYQCVKSLHIHFEVMERAKKDENAQKQ